ncbi:hypothetical protein [Shinella zoogloeoides]|uniref:hypothetical protein n=1 Tax=Shinella zoogloeoides TaxID=352475 RepID=UPI0028A7C99E|nr:hypothetical protein [Shinella zoogloeoides]
MKKPDPAELRRLRALILEKVNAVPPMAVHKGSSRDFDAERRERDRWHAAFDAIVHELVVNEGAKLTLSGGAEVLALAGIRCSCTHGSSGLLANWRAGALRRLEAMGEAP